MEALLNEEIHQQLGRQEADIVNIYRRLTQLELDVRSCLTILNQAQGSWKTIVAVGGIAGAAGALFMKLATMFSWAVK